MSHGWIQTFIFFWLWRYFSFRDRTSGPVWARIQNRDPFLILKIQFETGAPSQTQKEASFLREFLSPLFDYLIVLTLSTRCISIILLKKSLLVCCLGFVFFGAFSCRSACAVRSCLRRPPGVLQT